MTSTLPKEWLTSQEVADRLGVTVRTALRRFPDWYKMSRKIYRARPADVDRFIESRATFKAAPVRTAR